MLIFWYGIDVDLDVLYTFLGWVASYFIKEFLYFLMASKWWPTFMENLDKVWKEWLMK